MYKLYPTPLYIMPDTGSLFPAGDFRLVLPESLAAECKKVLYFPYKDLKALCKPDSSHIYSCNVFQKSMHREGYELSISQKGICIWVESAAGLFYALQTLKQLSDQSSGKLPFLEIQDAPKLDLRGIMLDIGRNKIPSMETMYALLDKFAAMRINHVEFYMEGYCFHYPEYAYLFSDETPVTAQEFQSLDTYAKSLFIDLVPNQNVLGHMDQYLATPQLNALAECEDGFIFENLFWRPPMTLDVRDSKSLEFVTGMLDHLLENFSSPLVNVNMDEPFELGKGKNKEEAEKNGTSILYLDYAKKINEYCRSKDKRMMMWGDQILEHPDSVAALPKDVILLDWIYEGDAHFETHAKLMEQTGLSYCLCPGTSSWGALTGRSDNMKKNIKDAVTCAINYHGLGIITTDWGDLGHWQYISSSYPAFALSGLYSWSGSQADECLADWFCNQYIYGDNTGQAYRIAYNLGNYYHYEHAPLYNTTLSFAMMSSKYTFDSLEEFDEKVQRLLTLSANIARTNHIPPKEPVIHLDYTGLQDYLDNLEREISILSLSSTEGNLILDEMRNSIRMIRHGSMLYYVLTEHRNNKKQLKEDLHNLYSQLDYLLKIHYSLWMARNRTGGFKKSISHMQHLLQFYQKQLKEL